MKTIKAQDIVAGQKLVVSGKPVVVVRVQSFKCSDGDTGYDYYTESGLRFWNRHNEEIVIPD